MLLMASVLTACAAARRQPARGTSPHARHHPWPPHTRPNVRLSRRSRASPRWRASGRAPR